MLLHLWSAIETRHGMDMLPLPQGTSPGRSV
jgi:hypothetical protein